MPCRFSNSHKRRSIFFLIPLSLLLILPQLSTTSLIKSAKAQDDDVVRINTDLVVLNVTVVDAAGKYVHGLKRSDFEVYEDGQKQNFTSFGAEETPFAAAVLIDTSGSMEQRLTLARSAAIRFLDGLRSDDVATVYRFDSKIERVQEFSSSRDLSPLLFGARAKGMTVLNDAVLRAAKDISERPEKRRAIIILSDGADTSSANSAEKALANAIAAETTIYSVNMGDTKGSRTQDVMVAAAALRNFANKTGGRYVATPGGEALREAFSGIVEELSNQYTIAYRPSNIARDGRWRSIEIKLTRPNLQARTRKGYRAPKSS